MAEWSPVHPWPPNGTVTRSATGPGWRADRNFGALLQELRVTRTGVQILFACLLTLAFTPQFPSLGPVQRAAVDRAEGVAAGVTTLVVCTGPWQVMPYLVKRAADRNAKSHANGAGGPDSGTDDA